MKSALFTKRTLYFAVMYLPLLLLPTALFCFYTRILIFVVPCYAPGALYLSLRGRKQSTRELLANSWRVPFVGAASTTFTVTFVSGWDGLETRSTAGLKDALSGPALAYYSLVGAGAATALLAFGWLLLLTIARKWPLDRASTA